MKIKIKNDGVKFDTTKPGDVFTFGQAVYMKIEDTQGLGGKAYNAVHLEHGQIGHRFKGDDCVILHTNAELTL